MTHNVKKNIDSVQEAKLIFLPFNAVFDRVNQIALLFKIILLGNEGSFLYVLSDFIREKTQCVSIDACLSSSCSIDSGVFQSNALEPFLYIIYTSDIWSSIESYTMDYADDTSFYATVRTSKDRQIVANYLDRVVMTILI